MADWARACEKHPVKVFSDSIIIICHWHIRICISVSRNAKRSRRAEVHTKRSLPHTVVWVRARGNPARKRERMPSWPTSSQQSECNFRATSVLERMSKVAELTSHAHCVYIVYPTIYIVPYSSGPNLILGPSYNAFCSVFFIGEKARKIHNNDKIKKKIEINVNLRNERKTTTPNILIVARGMKTMYI